MKKVAVLMSGGVDSSVAAALLQQQNCDVTGMHLQLASPCPDSGVAKAQAASDRLGVRLIVLDVAKEFAERIIQPFTQAYQKGLTPNPCIRCNRLIKFGLVLDKARDLGFDAIATGHYARIETGSGGASLLRAEDRTKDQSYFLYAIGRERLPLVLFPLGRTLKTETRRLAVQLGLPAGQALESQDVCFLGGGDYRDRLQKDSCPGGTITDPSGKVLGRHSGIENFTIGQRKGIGLSGGPFYVLRIVPETRTVVVGRHPEALASRLSADQACWLETVGPEQRVEAKVRSRHEAAAAVVESLSEREFTLRFSEPQWAITPGQSAVLYSGDRVLGGGIIQTAS